MVRLMYLSEVKYFDRAYITFCGMKSYISLHITLMLQSFSEDPIAD